MLKKDITYNDVDGNEITETFYFNMTKAELLKLELTDDEGFQARIERIKKPGTPGRVVLDTFDMIIRKAYGIRTPEGKFVKSDSAFQEFLASEAYSNLLFEIAQDAKKAAEFVNAVMPKDLSEEVAKMEQNRNIFEDAKNLEPAPVRPDQMSDEELMKELGISEEEPITTGGFTDDQIRNMSGAQLAKAGREVLLRAYALKK